MKYLCTQVRKKDLLRGQIIIAKVTLERALGVNGTVLAIGATYLVIESILFGAASSLEREESFINYYGLNLMVG